MKSEPGAVATGFVIRLRLVSMYEDPFNDVLRE